MDPIDQAKQAADKIETARATMATGREERRAAVLAARETMSATEVAAALHVSRARVYAIAAGRE